MHYIVEIHHTWDKISPKQQLTTKTYKYRLELDKDGKIIGGAWISVDRPDFIWKKNDPGFIGFFEDLSRIYKNLFPTKKMKLKITLPFLPISKS